MGNWRSRARIAPGLLLFILWFIFKLIFEIEFQEKLVEHHIPFLVQFLKQVHFSVRSFLRTALFSDLRGSYCRQKFPNRAYLGDLFPTGLYKRIHHQLILNFQDADFAEAQADVGVNFGDLEKLGVINICGVDKKGLPMIVVSACRFPLNTSEEHHQLFDFIQGTGLNNSKT